MTGAPAGKGSSAILLDCGSWVYPKIVIWVRMIHDDHQWSMRFRDPVLDKAMKAMFYFERFWNILKRCCRCSPKRQRQTQPLSFETGIEIWDDATGHCRTLSIPRDGPFQNGQNRPSKFRRQARRPRALLSDRRQLPHLCRAQCSTARCYCNLL